VEEFYHPEKYKIKFCATYPHLVDRCEYGELCAFAHAEEELNIEFLDKYEWNVDFYMFHFKTVWCPYNEGKHARDECVFAHNWQDFRRKPHIYSYKVDQCPRWHAQTFIGNFYEGCSQEYRCPFSHGWKEQEYHPENYKMNPCNKASHCPKTHCAYYHSEHDRRYPIDDHFKICPKNRGVSFPNHFYLRLFLDHMVQQNLDISQIYGCGPQSVPIISPTVVPKIPKKKGAQQAFNPFTNKKYERKRSTKSGSSVGTPTKSREKQR